MKYSLAIASICLLLTACDKGPENAGAGEQQKNQIDETAERAKQQIEEAAESQQKAIDAQAEAAKAVIEAEKAKARADREAAQVTLDKSSQQFEQAVEGAQRSISQAVSNTEQLVQQVREATQGAQGVRVSVQNGVVTINGSVQSEEQKRSIEQRIKRIDGVQEVKNNVQVEPRR